MKDKLLAILIPTYNRIESLMINLNMLEYHIKNLNCYDDIKIIVSDNNSIDGTYATVKEFFDTRMVDYNIFKQASNLGPEQNCVFCLKESNAKYSMFLGDDDYIDIRYLRKVLNYIKNDENITCIIPNFYAIDSAFNKMGEPRDVIIEDQFYLLNNNRIDLMFKAHQMSGLVFKTEGTLESYLSKDGENLYLFMYFAAFNIKRGKTIHILRFPVKVTTTNSKDWTYGDDGLITDVIQNIGMIAQSDKERFALERIFLRANKWRYLQYHKNQIPFLKIVFTSERYPLKLRWYIVWRIIVDSAIATTKKDIKLMFKIFGYEIKQRKFIKKK